MTKSEATNWVEAVAWILAAAIGTFAVAVDLHNSEVQAAVLVVLAGGFVLGAAVPRQAWRWALVLGCSIFAGEIVGYHVGLVKIEVDPGWNFTTLVALIPAFLGTYIGVGVRKVLDAAVTGL